MDVRPVRRGDVDDLSVRYVEPEGQPAGGRDVAQSSRWFGPSRSIRCLSGSLTAASSR